MAKYRNGCATLAASVIVNSILSSCTYDTRLDDLLVTRQPVEQVNEEFLYKTEQPVVKVTTVEQINDYGMGGPLLEPERELEHVTSKKTTSKMEFTREEKPWITWLELCQKIEGAENLRIWPTIGLDREQTTSEPETIDLGMSIEERLLITWKEVYQKRREPTKLRVWPEGYGEPQVQWMKRDIDGIDIPHNYGASQWGRLSEDEMRRREPSLNVIVQGLYRIHEVTQPPQSDIGYAGWSFIERTGQAQEKIREIRKSVKHWFDDKATAGKNKMLSKAVRTGMIREESQWHEFFDGIHVHVGYSPKINDLARINLALTRRLDDDYGMLSGGYHFSSNSDDKMVFLQWSVLR